MLRLRGLFAIVWGSMRLFPALFLASAAGLIFPCVLPGNAQVPQPSPAATGAVPAQPPMQPGAAAAGTQAPLNTPLNTQIDTLLQAHPDAMRAHWGVSLVDAATGATLYARNDGQYFEPASNAKLFTTATALALLGTGFTFDTRVVAEGTIDAAGTLHGDLRLIGGGDPTLSGRTYPYSGRTERSDDPLAGLGTLAAQVAASGIHAIDGPVLADDTLFTDERYGAGWSWDDLQWEYGAPVSALIVNDDVRYLTVTPGPTAGSPVTTSWLPDVPGLASGISLSATTSPRGTKPALGVARLPDGSGLRVYGTIPANGAPMHLALSLEDPASFAGRAFAAALASHGVTLHGGSAPVHRAPEDTQSFTLATHAPLVLHPLAPGAGSLTAASSGRVVATRQSVPLSDIVTVTNKVSQNLHAEMLLRMLGRAEGDDGSSAQGARVVRSFMTTDAGIAPDDFLLYDGSGLSGNDLVTPRALTTLLRYTTTQPWWPVLRNSLPVAGMDGTLNGRFPTLRGRIQAKTGTLGEVDALSGFLTTNSGRLVIFSILCNDHPGPGGRALMDAIIEAAAASF